MRGVEKLAAVVIGAVTSLAAWLLLVPWDLSEVDDEGRMLERGGDDYAGMIALVGGIVVAIGVGLVVSPRTRRTAAWFTLGGLVTWATLFAWRTSVSEVSGANMFVIPLVLAVIPLTALAPLAIGAVARWLQRRDDAGPLTA